MNITDGGHFQNAFNQIANLVPELFPCMIEGDLMLSNSAINNRGDQPIFINLKLPQNIGDFQAHPITTASRGPPGAHLNRLTFCLSRQFTSLFYSCKIQIRSIAAKVSNPLGYINRAFFKDCLLYFGFNHWIDLGPIGRLLPYAQYAETYRSYPASIIENHPLSTDQHLVSE